MSTIDAKVFEAFRSVGVADDKAILAAQALSRRDPDMDGIKADVASLRSDVSVLKHDVASLKPDVAGLKQDVAALKTDVALQKWILGVVMAMLLTLLFKAFHA